MNHLIRGAGRAKRNAEAYPKDISNVETLHNYIHTEARSSVGKSEALQGKSHRAFENGLKGRRFESCRASSNSHSFKLIIVANKTQSVVFHFD